MKEYFVIRAGRVVYIPGHHDIDGARTTARSELKAHPKATVRIVRIVETLIAAAPDMRAALENVIAAWEVGEDVAGAIEDARATIQRNCDA